MAVKYKHPALRLIYCSRFSQSQWKRAKRLPPAERARIGQCYAEEIKPGVWMCLCCNRHVKVVT